MLDWEPFHTLFKIVLNADLAVNSSSVWLSISGEETGTRTKPYVFFKKKKKVYMALCLSKCKVNTPRPLRPREGSLPRKFNQPNAKRRRASLFHPATRLSSLRRDSTRCNVE